MPEQAEVPQTTAGENKPFTTIPAPEPKPASSTGQPEQPQSDPSPEEPSVSPAPTNIDEQPERAAPFTPEAEDAPERELLNPEMAGAQAMLLFDGEKPDEATIKERAEKMNNGELPKLDNVNKSSFNQRDEAWNIEGYKITADMTKEQVDEVKKNRMKAWEKTWNKRFQELKGTPQAEFLQRLGVDIDNNGAKKLYDDFMKKEGGAGDLAYFGQKIAENNTPEQIAENKEFIQELAEIYGKDSTEAALLIAEGMKNAQTSPNTFSKTAAEQMERGDEMPGREAIEKAMQHSGKWEQKEQRTAEKKRQKEAEEAAADARDEEERKKSEQEKTEKTREELEIEEAKKTLTEKERTQITEKLKEIQSHALSAKEKEELVAAQMDFQQKAKEKFEELSKKAAEDEAFTDEMAKGEYTTFIEENTSSMNEIAQKMQQGYALFETKEKFLKALLIMAPDKINEVLAMVKPELDEAAKTQNEISFILECTKYVQPDGAEQHSWTPGVIAKQPAS